MATSSAPLAGVRIIEMDGDWSWPLRIGPAASAQIRIGA